MDILDSFYQNLDLLAVGVVINITVILGFVVFYTNRNSVSHRTFLGFALLTALWGTLNYLSYQALPVTHSLLILRATIFAATWLSFFFFLFALAFPKERFLPRARLWSLWLLSIWTGIVSALTLTSLVLKEVTAISPGGVILAVANGPAMPIFGTTTVGYALVGIIILIFKTFRAGREQRRQFLWIVSGVCVMFVSVVTTNFILPVFFNNPLYLPLAAIFVFPFIVFTSYAVVKLRLLNVRVIGTEIFIALLLLVILVQLVRAQEFVEILIQLGIYIGLVAIAMLLLRGVLQEVKQREEIEILAKDLERANVRLKELDKLKSEFVSIASHQLRSPLTSVKGYASLILEGSFGKVSDAVKEAVQRIFDSSQMMVASVEDFLNVSRIEQGRMKYELSVFDVGELAEKVIDENRPIADKKKLKLSYRAESKENTIRADIGKIKQVINNLIDNAIKYTEKGSIEVNISHRENMVRIEVHDTGVGISAETLSRLFDRFVRDKDARKVNVSGSGLGLYVAKQLVEGHKGKIWAESEGEGKGSIFVVELPRK